MLSNTTKYKTKYKTDDSIALFEDFIVSEGGTHKTVLFVGGVSQKASKVSLGYFNSETRKRIIKNVSI